MCKLYKMIFGVISFNFVYFVRNEILCLIVTKYSLFYFVLSFTEAALHQIENKKNDTELIASGVADIQKIGIAFRGKHAAVKK